MVVTHWYTHATGCAAVVAADTGILQLTSLRACCVVLVLVLPAQVFDGVRFIRYGCRKPPPRGAQKLSGSGTPFGSQSYNASSADSRALFSGTASSSSSSSSSASGTSGYDGADPTPAASAPTVSAASGYNAIGGSSSSAYTDL